MFFAFVSAFGFGTNLIFARLGLQYMRPSAAVIITSTMAFSIVMIFALTFYWNEVISIKATSIGALAVVGSLHFGIGRFLNLTSIRMSGPANQAALLASVPFFSSFFAITIGSETLTIPVIIGTIGITLGLIFIVAKKLNQTNKVILGNKRQARIGILLGLSTSIIYGLSVFLESIIVKELASPIVSSAFTLMFGAIFVALIFHRSAPKEIIAAPRKGIILLMLSGIGIAWGLSFLFIALSLSPVVMVGPAMNIAPLITLFLSYIFLKRIEKVTVSLVIGSLMIITGATIITVYG